MKVRVPKTLKAQALLIVTTAFLCSHVISLLLYEADRSQSIYMTEATDLAARIIGIVDLADSLPAFDREQILAGAQTQFLSLASIVPANSSCRENEFAKQMHEELQAYFQQKEGITADVCVRSYDDPVILRDKDKAGFDVLITIIFKDGAQFTFHAELADPPSLFQTRTLTYLIVLSTIFLLVAWYLILRVTKPLATLMHAANKTGQNIHTPSIPEQGPEEVVRTTHAFNRMQDRIQKLIQSQTEMIGAISHDLRSAITRLSLRVELLEDRETRLALNRIVDDMKEMVQAALDFARGVSPSEPIRKTDMAALIESLCDDLVNEGLPVTYNLLSDKVLYKCRASQLRRCFQNIISNAVKYGGNASITLFEQENNIVVRIEDNGPGVPEGEIQNLTQPYYRLETSRNKDTGGIGLGLAIADNITRSNGGDLKISNRETAGLRVDVIFAKLSTTDSPS